MSYEPVADGDLAAIVTYLEMHARPDPAPISSPLTLAPIEHPDSTAYRTLFRRIGAPWLWFSRLIMDDAALAAIIQHPGVDLYAVRDESGADVGMLELDFRETGQ